MKITPLKNNLCFQKTLKAKAYVGDEHNRQEVNIYLLDDESDSVEFEKAEKNPIWYGNLYVNPMMCGYEVYYDDANFYSMEDKDGQAICFCETADDKNILSLEHIETAPIFSSQFQTNLRLKYIGETMLAFLAKCAKRANKNIEVRFVRFNENTENFYYNQCHFKNLGKRKAFLNKNKFDNLIEQNKIHTNSDIVLVDEAI